jgi:hypothetical protein
MNIPPVKVLEAFKVSVPSPTLIREPGPVTGPPIGASLNELETAILLPLELMIPPP